MSVNNKRKILSDILKLSKMQYVYYVFLEDDDEIRRVKVGGIDELNNCVTTKSYGDKKYLNVYVNSGDFDPFFHNYDNILPGDVDYICRKNKNLRDEITRKRFAEGYLKLKILFYELIINAYFLNSYNYMEYINRLIIPKNILVSFLSKFEFFVELNENLKYFFSQLITRENYMSVLFFKTGFPRFSFADTNILLSSNNIKIDNEEKIQRFVNKITDNYNFLGYIDACLDNSSFIVKNTNIMVTYGVNKFLLHDILKREYAKEEYNMVKTVVQKYCSFSEQNKKITISLGNFFSKKEDQIFDNNKKLFLNF
jgi:hypothetical protein